MSFEIRPLDITEFKGDAIVNSMGVLVGYPIHGYVCKNILRKASSSELLDLIDAQEKNAEACFMFETPGFGLPSKHIIHVCTPHFVYDTQMFALEYVYKKILVTAYKKKWYKLALPIIGTGANRYPRAYVWKMILDLVKTFSDLHEKMKITICMPVASVSEYEDKFVEADKKANKEIKEFFDNNSKLKVRDFVYDAHSFENLDQFIVPYKDLYSTMKLHRGSICRGERDYWEYENNYDITVFPPPQEKKTFMSLKDALLDGGVRPVTLDLEKLGKPSITDYIDLYIETRFENPTDRKEIRRYVNNYLEGDENSTSIRSKNSAEEKRAGVKLPVLMRYILALHMVEDEANEFLKFCGKAFSPIGGEDKLYLSLIREKKFGDKEEINDLCAANKASLIFDYDISK